MLVQRIAVGAWGKNELGGDKCDLNNLVSEDKVEAYEAAFSKIQAASGIKNIDELINQFIEAEDKNFSLFNHVNR